MSDSILQPAAGRAHSPEPVLFAVTLTVLVAALWRLPWPGFAEDGAALALGRLLAGLMPPETLPPDLSAATLTAEALGPNGLVEPLFALLLAAAPAATAAKLLLSVCVVALPLAMRYAVTAVYPDNAPLGWYALPFLFSAPLGLGYYDLLFSLPLLLLSLGYLLRHWRRLGGGDGAWPAAVLAGLGLLTGMTHPLSGVALALMLACFAGWLLFYQDALPRRFKPAEPTVRDGTVPAGPAAAKLGLALMPLAALLAERIPDWWETLAPPGTPNSWIRLEMLVTGEALLPHARWEVLLTLPVALLPFAGAVMLAKRRWTWRKLLPRDGLLAGALAVTAAGLVLPAAIAGDAIPADALAVPCLLVFPPLLVVFWLGIITSWKTLRRVIVAVSGIAAVGLLAVTLHHSAVSHPGTARTDSPDLGVAGTAPRG